MQPALGLLEFASIADGIAAGDAMVKRAPVEVLCAGTVHPGKYLVLVAGEVAEVEEAMIAGRETGGETLDEVFLPDVHPRVPEALCGGSCEPRGEALGIVETTTAAAILGAADRGLKGAEVDLQCLRLADDLGGKAYCLFTGTVAEIEVAVEIAVASFAGRPLLVRSKVISQLHDEMAENLEAAPAFLPRVRSRRGG